MHRIVRISFRRPRIVVTILCGLVAFTFLPLNLRAQEIPKEIPKEAPKQIRGKIVDEDGHPVDRVEVAARGSTAVAVNTSTVYSDVGGDF